MKLPQFRERVKQAFGERLEHATPANVREFLDQLQKENWQSERAEQRVREGRADVAYPIPTASSAQTWESLVREFFLQSLEIDQEQALIMLWVFALDMAYSGIEELHSDTMNRLFRDLSA